MANLGFHPPTPLNVLTGNIPENFRKWKQQLQTYMMASGLNDTQPPVKKAIILNLAGEDVLEISNHFKYAVDEDGDPVEDPNDPNLLLTKIEEYCTPKQNEVYESYKFWSTPMSSPIDHFVSELRTRVKNCNYGALSERMIRDKIMFTLSDDTLKFRLMRDAENLTLDKLVSALRVTELTQDQIKHMNTNKNSVAVNAVGSRSPANRKPGRNPKPPQNDRSTPQKTCHFCDRKHPMKKELCPAWGKTCDLCKRKNHFKVKCPQNKSSVHCVEQDLTPSHNSGATGDSFWIGCLHADGKRLYAMMGVNDQQVKFQLDSGAETNTVCEKYVPYNQIRPTHHKLVVWNGSRVDPVGETTLKLTNPVNQSEYSADFVVVNNNFTNLIGLSLMKTMNLITVNTDTFQIAKLSCVDITQQYPLVFDGKLGRLPSTVKLRLKPDITPKILPPRTIPFALQDELKSELARLTELGVLKPVSEPTEWVSQMVCTRKKDSSLRVCLDPRQLNNALMREHYRLPTLEDSLTKFANAKVFSKLDVASAYWHLELDEEASVLTTMITPFGRYRWLRLPFGLCVSSEIFQRNLMQVLEGLTGVACIADDIAVVGIDDADHDVNLESLLKRCNDCGIKLNKDKFELRCTEMVFHGHVFTPEGIKPDPSKIHAIVQMPTPQDVGDVKRFNGMVQYLAKFLPELAELTTPLRALTHKDSPWEWKAEHQTAFDDIKLKITQAPLLAHYDPNEQLVLQADSSQHGLGVALLQKGVPIAYASRALTPTESRYAQIEKECLSIVYGLERFDQYTFGRFVVVENDHKPLETIIQKPLNTVPKRLQAMMMRLSRYDISLKYKPGPQMVLPDTLSRAFPTADTESSGTFDSINALQYLPISDKRVEELCEATDADETMCMLRTVIINGWPENKDLLPDQLRPYYPIRDCLTVQDGIVMKGERLVIPIKMRRDIKEKLHAAHLGKDSMLRRARELVYWPGMAHEVTEMADTCEVCQLTAKRQQAEPLIPHERGERPFQKIGIDLFVISGRNYMVTVDYLSNFFEIDHLPTTTTSAILIKLKAHIARYGIPESIMSDNAQFVSAEFQQFAKDWGITHITSSPGHSQSNGKAEAAVKSAKSLITKCMRDGSDQYMALLELRNTPMQTVNMSPAQIMFSRRIRTSIPTSAQLLSKSQPEVRAAIDKRVELQTKSYNRNTKSLPPLNVGDPVIFDHFQPGKKKPKWVKGTVSSICTKYPRSYMVTDQSGTTYRRNRVHIRLTKPYAEPVIDMDIALPDLPEPIVNNRVQNDNIQHNFANVNNRVNNDNQGDVENNVNLNNNLIPNQNAFYPRRSNRARRAPAYLEEFQRD